MVSGRKDTSEYTRQVANKTVHGCFRLNLKLFIGTVSSGMFKKRDFVLCIETSLLDFSTIAFCRITFLTDSVYEFWKLFWIQFKNYYVASFLTCITFFYTYPSNYFFIFSIRSTLMKCYGCDKICRYSSLTPSISYWGISNFFLFNKKNYPWTHNWVSYIIFHEVFCFKTILKSYDNNLQGTSSIILFS